MGTKTKKDSSTWAPTQEKVLLVLDSLAVAIGDTVAVAVSGVRLAVLDSARVAAAKEDLPVGQHHAADLGDGEEAPDRGLRRKKGGIVEGKGSGLIIQTQKE
jgi:hypothetical protein